MRRMSRKELLSELRELKDTGEPEDIHVDALDLLMAYIGQPAADDLLLGHINDEEVTAAFRDLPNWYA